MHSISFIRDGVFLELFYLMEVTNMKTYKVYVAGRVSSDPNYKEKFSRYCKMIEASSTKDIKYIAVNPTAQAGFEDENLSFYQHIKLDFQHLIKCDIILLTSGWENSKGCNMEYAFACGTNKIILEAEKVPVYHKDTKTYYGTIDAAYNDSDNAIFDFEESINKYNERQSLKDKYMEEYL